MSRQGRDIFTLNMDLIFAKDSAQNTTLSLPDGRPAYEVTTPARNFHTEVTTIKKYRSDGGTDDIGTIEFHMFHKDIVQIRGKDFLPKSLSMWKKSVYLRTSTYIYLTHLILLLASCLSLRHTGKDTRGSAAWTQLWSVIQFLDAKSQP